MITYTDTYTDNIIKAYTDIINYSTINKGDVFYIPKNPKWIVTPTENNPTARAHVLAVKIIDDEMVVKPIYRSQMCRVDVVTKKLVFIENMVNRVVYDVGIKGFNRKCSGKLLEIVDVDDNVMGYAYDELGNRLEKLKKTKAYAFNVKTPENINEDEIAKVIDKYIKENYKEIDKDKN